MNRILCTFAIIAAFTATAHAEEPKLETQKITSMGDYADADEAEATLTEIGLKVTERCTNVMLPSGVRTICGCVEISQVETICVIEVPATTVAAN